MGMESRCERKRRCQTAARWQTLSGPGFRRTFSCGTIVTGLVLLCPVLAGAAGVETVTLRLATGSKTGVYYPIGCGIKRVIEAAYPDLVSVEVVQTSGALENLRLIDNGQVDLALAQNDLVYYFSQGREMFSLPSSNALALASMYTELVQIIATHKSGIEYLDQLKGRRIRTGSPPANVSNSGTVIFAQDGWEASDLTDIRCGFAEARNLLLANDLDAACVTAGIPTPLLTEKIDGISLQDIVRLIPVNEGLANRLMRAFPYFVYTEIPVHTYRGQNEAVKTVGVRAILVARRHFEETGDAGRLLPPDFVRHLTRLVFEKEQVIRTQHGVAGADLSGYHFALDQALYGILDRRMKPIIPVHPQSMAYFREQGLLKKTLADYLPAIFWSSLCLVLLAAFVRYRSPIMRFTQKHAHVRLLTTFVCLYVIGALAMFFCEHYNNRSFQSLPESFWSITVYLFSGFEDRYPITWPGRIVSVLIFVLSVSFFGAVAGRFAAAFLQRQEIKMPKDVADHIVICNWNERGKRVISELRHPEGRPNADIVIVDNKAVDEKELRRLPIFHRVYCIHEDPIRHGTLKSARVSLADTVIVLGDDESPDPDAKSAMVILALLSECRKRRPHIIAEVVNSDNSQHLRDAGADETICTTEIGVGILAHCAVNKQLSVVYKDLLTYSFEGNEIYIIPPESYPESFVGKTFAECAQILYAHRDRLNPVILLGIRRQDKVIMNPRSDPGGLDNGEAWIGEGDALIAMAFSLPNLRTSLSDS
jgi:TRAP transporter TAXI family solute receptor